MLVFISGPFRSDEAGGRENNIWAARMVSLELWKRGIPNICPHLNSGTFYGEVDEELIRDGYCEMVKYCTHVIMLNGWKESNGACGEFRMAKGCGIPTYLTLEEFLNDAGKRKNTNRS